jgi:regulator of protease activity HflC (stomatin/prohibitin superfamily)
MVIQIIIGIVIFIVLVSIKQINQYENGIKFTLGKFSGIMTPGWKLMMEKLRMVIKWK